MLLLCFLQVHGQVRDPRHRRGEDGREGRGVREAAQGLRPHAEGRAGPAEGARRRQALVLVTGGFRGRFRFRRGRRQAVAGAKRKLWPRISCLALLQITRRVSEGSKQAPTHFCPTDLLLITTQM